MVSSTSRYEPSPTSFTLSLPSKRKLPAETLTAVGPTADCRRQSLGGEGGGGLGGGGLGGGDGGGGEGGGGDGKGGGGLGGGGLGGGGLGEGGGGLGGDAMHSL